MHSPNAALPAVKHRVELDLPGDEVEKAMPWASEALCFPHPVVVPLYGDLVTPRGLEAVKLEAALLELLPLTHFVRATRSVFLKGEGALVVVCEMLPVALFALTATALALLAYQRRLD
jgi:hypothetical protein